MEDQLRSKEFEAAERHFARLKEGRLDPSR